jgi:hypothetical protein
MTIIANIDAVNRRVYLHADTVGVDFQPMDMYKEMRVLRRTDETLRPYDVFMISQGNEPTGPSSSTPRRVRLEKGTRVVPFDTDQNLKVIGEIITDDGLSGIDCFDRTPLSPSTTVNIDYQPPQVEIITVNTGSGVTPSDIDAIATAVWSEPTTSITTIGSIGEYILTKLLTFKKFFSTKDL